MAHFRYQALNAEQQLVSGELHAETVSQAITQLESQGLTIQSIGYVAADLGPNLHIPTAGAAAPRADAQSAVSDEERAEWTALNRHMSRVIEQGRAIVPALRAYAEEMSSRRQRDRLNAMLRILERGDSGEATNALLALPLQWIPLLGAAAARDPARVLRGFLKESRRADELRRLWWQTIAYPLLVGGIATLVVVALSLFVIPVFQDIFASFGLKLPGLTRFIFLVAFWITSGRVVIAAMLLAGAVFLLWAAGLLLPQPLRDWFGDRFGTLLGRSTTSARFSQFLADLLEAELDIPGSLRIAGFATASPRVRRAARRLASDLSAGREPALHAYRPFLTAAVIHALHADVPTASRVRLLTEISSCHTDRARHYLSWTRGTIEPLAICLIAAVVGTVVVALFLPLFSLIQALS